MSGHQDNMDILCRLCLCDDGKIPIFSNADNSLSLRIFQCVAIEVENDEKLPLNVCPGCVSCIDSWFLFKDKCHKTQHRLQSMVQKAVPQDTVADDLCNGIGNITEEAVDLSEAVKSNESIPVDEGHDDSVRLAEEAANPANGVVSQAATELNGAEEQSKPAEGSPAIAEVAESPAEEDQSKLDDSPKPDDVAPVKSVESKQSEVPQAEASRTEKQPGMDVDEEPMDDDEEYEEFEEDLDEFDEPESAQLINPKFAAKLMNMKHEAAQMLDSAAQQSNLRKADSTGAAPSRPVTVNLCEEEEEEEDDEVSVIEPVIEKINLDPPEQITSTVSQDSAASEVVPKAAAPKDGASLRIESAVTLPAPGDLFQKKPTVEDSAEFPGEAEGTEHIPSAGTSRDNSPDRMSAVEDDQFEDEGISQDRVSAPRSVGDPNRTTPDSTMISANQEENEESQLCMDFVIKEETMRGYADEEEEASIASFESSSSLMPENKSRDEYLREMLLSDPTVDVNKDKCIICDHVFYTVSSLLRHTKCRMHLDTRAIWEMQQKGQEVDPVLLAMHQRKLDAYRLTWNISRKRVAPPPEGPRPPGTKKFTCRPCKVSASSFRDWDRHKNSKKHKLIMMLGEMPTEEELSEKKPPRKIVRPQPLQYDHSQPPQHLPKPMRPKMPSQPMPGQPMPGQSSREYICPIPNCGYICYEGPLLLTHMTSHGIQGNAPVQQMKKPMQATPKSMPPMQATPKPMQPMQAKPLQTSTPIMSQPKPVLSQLQPMGSSFPQHQQRPYKVAQKYENLFCKYHNIFFETARGYLNHIRHCAMAPPISTFLKPEYKGTTSDKRYCKLCDLSFSTPDMLIQHMGVYHKGSAVQQEMSRPPVPAYMPKTMHSAKSGVKHKCHLCGKVFNLLHSLNFHLRSHRQQVSSSTPGNTTCKVCKKVFLTRKSCATHLKTHFLHPGSNKMFCSLCYKTFDTRSEIARHRYDGTCHTPLPAAGPFNCELCDFQCKDSGSLSDHRLKFHTDIKEEKPDEEEEQVDVMEEEEEGDEIHEEPPPEPEQEQQQHPHQQQQQQPHQQQPHQQQPHQQQQQQQALPQPQTPEVNPAEQQCKCLLCGKTFYSYANVKRHCRFIHRMPDSKVDNMIKLLGSSSPKGPPPGPPPLTPLRKHPIVNKTCGRCGENFTNKQLFEEHLLSCNEVAHESPCEQCGTMCGPEGCPNCSQRASQKTDPGGLLFKCPIGHMSFSDENAMLKHYSYCTGNCGPYFECGNCGCEFRYRKNFDIHNCALARKKTTYDCTECRRSFSKKLYLINHEMKCPGVNSAVGLDESSPSTSYSSNSAKKTRQSGPVEDDEERVEETPAETEPQPPQVFSCGSCERIFHSSKALCGHMRSHKKAPPEDPMFCKFCGRENLILSNLYGHVYKCAKSLFMTEEVLTCEECSTFLSRYDTPKELSAKLHHHVLNCYPIPWYQNQGDAEGSEKLLCYICCHAFSSVEALTIHKSHHNRMKGKRGSPFLKTSPKKRPRYSRPIKQEFDPNDMIEEEILESGDSPPPASNPATQFILNCQVCNRQFNNIDKLRNHEKVHGIVRQVVSESDGIEEEREQEQS